MKRRNVNFLIASSLAEYTRINQILNIMFIVTGGEDLGVEVLRC